MLPHRFRSLQYEQMKNHLLSLMLFSLVATSFSLVPSNGAHSKDQRKADSTAVVSFRPDTSFGSEQLTEPVGIAVDTRGTVFVADGMAGRIYGYPDKGGYIEFENPQSTSSIYPIDITLQGSLIYVLDYTGNRILRYDYRGMYLDVLISFDRAGGGHPVSVTSMGDGRIIATDIENHSLIIWSSLGSINLEISEFGKSRASLNSPRKAIVLDDGTIVVVDPQSREMKFFSPAGRFEFAASPVGNENVFVTPRYLSYNHNGYIFVADSGAGKVFVFDSRGRYISKIDSFRSGSIEPSAVAAGWNDRLYVTDLNSSSILIYDIRYRQE